MDPVTSATLIKALDGLSLRLQVSAANVANANSSGFRPSSVAFEDSLRAAAARGPAAVKSSHAVILPMSLPVGGEQRLDLELETASETGMRYAALVNMLGREIEISRMAIRGGQ